MVFTESVKFHQNSQMCLNGAVVFSLVSSFFGFAIVTWFKFEPKRSLDTSAVSFLFRFAGEEFEYESLYCLAIDKSLMTKQ